MTANSFLLTAMPLAQFILKMADQTEIATFDERPNWLDLATKIASSLKIPIGRVGVIGRENDNIILRNDEELQRFYESSDKSSQIIEFVAKDLLTPDGERNFAGFLAHILIDFLVCFPLAC